MAQMCRRKAAADLGQTVTIRPYLPVPLAPNDPYALVSSLLLTSLLVGGYAGAALLASAAGSAGRGHGLILIGFAVVAGFMVDVIGTVILQGLPAASFWVVWPIMSLIVLVVALVAAVLATPRRAAGHSLDGRRRAPVRESVQRRRKRRGVPANVLLCHRALLATTERVLAASKHRVLQRQRHHPGSGRPARLRAHLRRRGIPSQSPFVRRRRPDHRRRRPGGGSGFGTGRSPGLKGGRSKAPNGAQPLENRKTGRVARSSAWRATRARADASR